MLSAKSFQRVVVLLVWAILVAISVIRPVDASYQLVKDEVVVVAPYSESEVVLAANKARSDLGLAPVIINAKLSAAAQSRAEHMVQNNYFDHVTPAGEMFSNFLQRSGYVYRQAGENIAMQQTTVESLLQAWQLSPSHQRNLANTAFTDTGVGVAYGEVGGREGWFVVQLFGVEL
jgi:uncharacterized protein YkwD